MNRRSGIVMTGVIAVILGGMLVLFIVQQSGKPNNNVDFGQEVFPAGQVEPLARNIAKNGPIFYAALTSGGPDIYVQHAGGDPVTGWRAFDAQQPGQTRKCTLVWRAATRDFEDPCTKQTFPADGTGLRQYKTTVTSGALTIDFRTVPSAPAS